MIIITTCKERRRRHTHTHTGAAHRDTDKQEQETGMQKDPDSYSLSVSHCKSQLSVLPPSCFPSLQSCVDIRLVQKGSAQLIAGPKGVGGGVQRGETWVGGGSCSECECMRGGGLGAAAQGLGGLPCSLRYGGQGLGGAARPVCCIGARARACVRAAV